MGGAVDGGPGDRRRRRRGGRDLRRRAGPDAGGRGRGGRSRPCGDHVAGPAGRRDRVRVAPEDGLARPRRPGNCGARSVAAPSVGCDGAVAERRGSLVPPGPRDPAGRGGARGRRGPAVAGSRGTAVRVASGSAQAGRGRGPGTARRDPGDLRRQRRRGQHAGRRVAGRRRRGGHRGNLRRHRDLHRRPRGAPGRGPVPGAGTDPGALGRGRGDGGAGRLGRVAAELRAGRPLVRRGSVRRGRDRAGRGPGADVSPVSRG